MTQLVTVKSKGIRGPAYLIFSYAAVTSTEPTADEDEVVVDYDIDGEVVGIELVAITPDTIRGLVAVAYTHELDLSLLFTQNVTMTPV